MRRTSFALTFFAATALSALFVACGGSESPNGFGDDDGNSSGGNASGGNTSGGNASGGNTSGGGGGIDPGSSGGASSSGEPPVCATTESTVERQPVYLAISLDDSGSMKGTKWTAARDALAAYFSARGTEASPLLALGLDLFNRIQPAQPLGLVDPAQAAALTAVMPTQLASSSLGTPTLEAYNRSVASLRSFTPSAPLLSNGRLAVLLVTDGVPSGGNAKAAVTAAVTAALAGGDQTSIATAVIGVGNTSDSINSFDPAFLSRTAQAGGLAAPGCNPAWAGNDNNGPACHYQITPGTKTAAEIQAELAAAIDAISGTLVSCELLLNATDTVDPNQVNVVYTPENGAAVQVPADPENGWTLDDPTDPTAVILHGQACDTLKGGSGHVKVVLGCPTGTSVIN